MGGLPPVVPRLLPLCLPALVGDLALGPPANYWAVLACFKPLKVTTFLILVLLMIDESLLAEAIDQWFENLQNYEATLASSYDNFPISNLLTYLYRKKWPLPPLMLISKRS